MHGHETIRKLNDEQYAQHTAKQLESAKKSNIPEVVKHFQESHVNALSKLNA